MFKVFIYLYIFLESVLCKTWFWLFAQSGEVGAAVIVALWVATGKCPRFVATEVGGGPCTESEEAAQHCLAYSILTGECHPGQEGQSPLGQKQHFASSPLFVLLVGQLPLWGGLLPPFCFSDSPPFLYPDPTINAKGAPGTWGGSWPPLPKSSTGRLPPSACPMWPH